MKIEDFKESDFNKNEAIKAQREYQIKNDAPEFAPACGVCWACYNQIYSPMKHSDHVSGITLEKAKVELITGCPHCHRSYCD